ncbi:MAG: hypothetical protein H7X80_04265, partial [bacterium]|nr:hypothetical protein [Candidatus Kapabacteria bacterium]
YNLVEVDLKPTEATAIAFVRDLHFLQRFERLTGDVWYPTFMEITGAATVEIVKGFAQIDATVKATSIVSEAIVNEALPDSIFGARDGSPFASRLDQIITAAPDADSARAEFWENNALSELSKEEKETYSRIDSLVAEADTAAREDERGFSFSAFPMIDFNRVAGITVVGNASLDIGSWADVGLSASYGFAIKRPFIEADATISIVRERDVSLSLNGSVYSKLGVNHWDRSIPRVVNTVTAALFHRDYYDWFRHDGWNVGMAAEVFGIEAKAGFENARHLGIARSNTRSIFVAEPLRANPVVPDGNYSVVSASLAYGRSDEGITISSGSGADFGVKISGVFGEDNISGLSFKAAEGKLSVELPTFGTGYIPMSLRIAAHGGIGSDELPLEYQFRMRTAASIVSPFGHFTSAPIAAFGGARYVALHGEHNFSDIVWRWIGLPTYWGRGIEFIVAASAGQYGRPADSLFLPSLEPFPVRSYAPTGNEWYTEVGFGLGKIPTFISNVAFLRIDARFGVGELARGNWGMTLGLSSPF